MCVASFTAAAACRDRDAGHSVHQGREGAEALKHVLRLPRQVACVFALLLMFRVLSTTAEDYFSPVLTQMSKDFYLPPRLAGGPMCDWRSPVTSTSPAVFCSRGGWRRRPADGFEPADLDERPAAVTLMAWGNGAPDIFSSMAAVKSGEYQLALGGQLGAPPTAHLQRLRA